MVKRSFTKIEGVNLLEVTLQKNTCDRAGPATLGGARGACQPPTFLCSKKKKWKQRKARKTFKAETIKRLSLRSKLYCLSHSRTSSHHGWLTILFSVPWPLHFEIYFVGPVELIFAKIVSGQKSLTNFAKSSSLHNWQGPK